MRELIEALVRGHLEFFGMDRALTDVGFNLDDDALGGHYFGTITAISDALKSILGDALTEELYNKVCTTTPETINSVVEEIMSIVEE